MSIFFKHKVDVLTPSGSILTDWVGNKLASVPHAISSCVYNMCACVCLFMCDGGPCR